MGSIFRLILFLIIAVVGGYLVVGSWNDVKEADKNVQIAKQELEQSKQEYAEAKAKVDEFFTTEMVLIPEAFAQEIETEKLDGYTDYINTDVLKIKFNYPSDWEGFDEKISRFDTNPSIQIAEDLNDGPIFQIGKGDQGTTSFDVLNLAEMYLDKVTSSTADYRISGTDVVEKTHMTKIGNGGTMDAATFVAVTPLTTLFGGSTSDKMGTQAWIFKIGTYSYNALYMENTDTFDSSESTEIRNNIINSLEFLP